MISLVKNETSVSVAPVHMDFDAVVGANERSETEIRTELGIGERPVILFAGRFTGQKNLSKLLSVKEIVADSSDFDPVFILAGDGPVFPEIAKESGEDLILPGWVEIERLAEFFAIANIFLITSHWEGTSRVVVEAGMNGLPVVTTPFAGALDNVVDGETGYVTDEVKNLADGVTTLLENPSLRSKMGRKAREKLEQRFDTQRLIHQYVSFLGVSEMETPSE
jgi:glycosyltransferase involved in cell wall biosynthesis